MSFRWLVILASLALLPLTEPVSGQTTRPVEQIAQSGSGDWSRLISTLAEHLVSPDSDALQGLLQPHTSIRRLNSEKGVPAARLLAATSRAKLLSANAYPGLPASLASDIAASVRSSRDMLPQSVQDEFVPVDDRAEKRANKTAAEWLAQVLQPSPDQPVAVLLFLPATDRRLPDATTPRRPIFVLVKGQQTDGSIVLTDIHFGDPLETPR